MKDTIEIYLNYIETIIFKFRNKYKVKCLTTIFNINLKLYVKSV